MDAHLKEAGVDVKDYEAMLDDVRALAASGSTICIDPHKVRMGTKRELLCTSNVQCPFSFERRC